MPFVIAICENQLILEESFKLHNQKNVSFVPLEPGINHQHVMVWRKNDVLSPVASKFVAFVQNKTMLYHEG